MNLHIPFPGSELFHLSISFSNDVITGIEFLPHKATKNTDTDSGTSDHKMIFSDAENLAFGKTIKQEFNDYFSLVKHQFSLPCNLPLGTPFQQKVWRALTRIPAGEVKTYGQLARELNSSPRAVGNACRKNPFPVIVPCHRVVSASGIGGYAGDTLTTQKGMINYLQIKQWLLAHEHANIE